MSTTTPTDYENAVKRITSLRKAALAGRTRYRFSAAGDAFEQPSAGADTGKLQQLGLTKAQAEFLATLDPSDLEKVTPSADAIAIAKEDGHTSIAGLVAVLAAEHNIDLPPDWEG